MAATYPGVGDRILFRLKAMGYWQKKKDRPDLMRFSRERHWHPATYLYEWCFKGVVPTLPFLERLAKDLDVPMAWLLLGAKGIDDVREHLPTLDQKIRVHRAPVVKIRRAR
jgi:hypothetical protein